MESRTVTPESFHFTLKYLNVSVWIGNVNIVIKVDVLSGILG